MMNEWLSSLRRTLGNRPVSGERAPKDSVSGRGNSQRDWLLKISNSTIIDIDTNVRKRGSVIVTGNNNKMVAKDGSRLSCNIKIEGDNNQLLIEEAAVFRGQIIIKGRNQVVRIGAHSTFQSAYLLCQEDCSISIGRWCMFSRDIEVRTSDAHSVVDVRNGRRINMAKSIDIGDHVWVGVGALISKGAVVPSDVVVGAYSFVNRQFDESQCIIAGVPAKMVKRGVTWHRSRKKKYSSEELGHWRELERGS